jgi:hypothetical protein
MAGTFPTAVHAEQSDRPLIFIVRLDSQSHAAADEWIPVTDGKSFDDTWRRSADRKSLYFISQSDGIVACISGESLEETLLDPPLQSGIFTMRD